MLKQNVIGIEIQPQKTHCVPCYVLKQRLNFCKKSCRTNSWIECCTDAMKSNSKSPCSDSYNRGPDKDDKDESGRDNDESGRDNDNSSGTNSSGSGSPVVVVIIVAAVVIVIVVCSSMAFMATMIRPSAPGVENKYREKSSNDIIIGTVVDGVSS